MRLICQLLGHLAGYPHYRSHGIDFAICLCCRADVIRRAGEDWQPMAIAEPRWRNDPAPFGLAPPRRHASRPAGGDQDRQRRFGLPMRAPPSPDAAGEVPAPRARPRPPGYRRWWLTVPDPRDREDGS